MTCDEFRADYPRFRFPGPASRLSEPGYAAWVGHLDGCRACGDWYQGEEVRARGVALERYPCVHLAYYTAVWFADRADAGTTQNVAIVYNPRFDEFGIHLYDRSVLGIRYCPWCGKKTPESRRDEWLARAQALGLTDQNDPRLPDELKSDAWYRK